MMHVSTSKMTATTVEPVDVNAPLDFDVLVGNASFPALHRLLNAVLQDKKHAVLSTAATMHV